MICVQEKRVDFHLEKLLEEGVPFEFHTMGENNLFLSDSQIEVLKRYNIDYKKHTLTSLIYEIDRQLSEEEDIELALILEELSEYHYYKEVRK